MGVVHLGLDPHGRAVAIKVLRAHIAYDPDARARLSREVATLSRVRHPLVAEVLDADVDGDQPYVVTRYVPGPTLDAEVRERGPMPAAHLVRLGRGLSSALEAIHAAGVVHRDLKPGNVLLLDGDPVVIDFGIAHVADDVRLTMTGLVMGTPGYLAPELVEGRPVTEATDWWGWAATLAFAASGRAPFGKGPLEAVLDRVRRGVPRPGRRRRAAAAAPVRGAWRPTPRRGRTPARSWRRWTGTPRGTWQPWPCPPAPGRPSRPDRAGGAALPARRPSRRRPGTPGSPRPCSPPRLSPPLLPRWPRLPRCRPRWPCPPPAARPDQLARRPRSHRRSSTTPTRPAATATVGRSGGATRPGSPGRVRRGPGAVRAPHTDAATGSHRDPARAVRRPGRGRLGVPDRHRRVALALGVLARAADLAVRARQAAPGRARAPGQRRRGRGAQRTVAAGPGGGVDGVRLGVAGAGGGQRGVLCGPCWWGAVLAHWRRRGRADAVTGAAVSPGTQAAAAVGVVVGLLIAWWGPGRPAGAPRQPVVGPGGVPAAGGRRPWSWTSPWWSAPPRRTSRTATVIRTSPRCGDLPLRRPPP